MHIAIGTVVPPAMLPAGATMLVSVGAPLVIAVLVAALVAIGEVLVQGALCASPERRPAVGTGGWSGGPGERWRRRGGGKRRFARASRWHLAPEPPTERLAQRL